MINATHSLPMRSQFLIFTLFGDYLLDRGGAIWTSSLIYLMGLLGLSERGVRSTLSRMTTKGWLTSKKYGRRSKYSITRLGKALLERGSQRIFEPIFSDWNGEWQMVLYSLPEKKRSKRHLLRTQLIWLGFGSLAPGAWISPHDRMTELRSLFEELDVDQNTDLFAGKHLGPATAKELVDRCWDLTEIEELYRDFAGRYEPEYGWAIEDGLKTLTPKDCFLRRYCMTYEFQSYPRKDPNLPTVLLPPDWIGFTARELFNNYRNLLSEKANQFVDTVMQEEGRH